MNKKIKWKCAKCGGTICVLIKAIVVIAVISSYNFYGGILNPFFITSKNLNVFMDNTITCYPEI